MRPALSPLVLGVFCAAAADASFAFRGVIAAHSSLGSAITAFIVSMAVAASPMLLVVVVVWSTAAALQSSVGATRRFLRGLACGHAPLAVLVLTLTLGLAATRMTIIGRDIITSQTPHVAAMLLVVVTIGAMAFALVGGVLVLRAVAPVVVALERRAPAVRIITRGIGARLTLAFVIAALLDTLLLREYVIAPAVGIAAWLGASGSARAGLARRHGPSRARIFFAAASVLATFVAPHALARLPGSVRLGVTQRPPYGALVLGAARRLVDRDHDGYSPILGGGDCDDFDPAVHPGAHDVPGNGRDENCSGADAARLAPTPPPVVERPAALAARPNIVIVLVDALRPDHLSFNGHARPTSPAIDRFRETAIWFRRAYAPAPSTRFSLASIFTGLDIESIPQRRGPSIDFELLPDAETLAEKLDRIGYDRVGFTMAYVLDHMKGMGQGFRVWSTPFERERAAAVAGYEAPLMTDAAVDYLSSATTDGSRPFLLYTHYQCTHAPYVRHADHDFGDGDDAAYDSALAYCDEHIGRLLAAVDARADRDRTIVVLMSDHGELLGEHGMDQHGTSMLEPAMRALLLMRATGYATRTVDAPVMLTDLNPTLLALADAPPTSASTAWNLGAFLDPSALPPPRPLFLYIDDRRAGVRYEARGVVDGRYKLIRDLTSGAGKLFDLESDPGETKNLRRALPEVRARASGLIDAWDPGVDFR